MAAKIYTYEFPRPAVTVDVVVVTREKSPCVLLVRRANAPFQGAWALPGGFIEMHETLEASAQRELLEETGLRVSKLSPLGTFGDPGRDPRGRTITVAFLVRVPARRPEVTAGDDAAEAAWHPLHRLPKLAFDHREILKCARRQLA